MLPTTSGSSVTTTKLVSNNLDYRKREFLQQINEAYRSKKKIGMNRNHLKELGFIYLAQLSGSNDLLYFDFGKKFSNTYHFQKRCLDVIGASIAIILLLPLGLLISLAVLIDAGWPIFYVQYRLNHRGKKMFFIKFRSMRRNSDKDPIRLVAMASFINGEQPGDGTKKIINGTLVTKTGRFLRKYSLDELPQLISVLTGTMSLVGPRPCLQHEYDSYREWHKIRLTVKPGCTGLWQVFGRSVVSFDESVLMDIYYSTQQNFLTDLTLITRTIPVMITGKGGL